MRIRTTLLTAALAALYSASAAVPPPGVAGDHEFSKDAIPVAVPRPGDGAPQSCADGFGGPPETLAPPIAGGWKLTFQDNFLGAGLDGTKWKVGQHWAGVNGLASNDPNNVVVKCGYVTLSAHKRANTFGNKKYTYAAAELTSFKRFRQKYGYFEARLRYDGIRGLWPAFWLMPDRGAYGNTSANRISYLKFDLSGDSRDSVNSATLRLHVEDADAEGQNLVLLRVPDDSWQESSVTWVFRPEPDPLWLGMRFDPQLIRGSTVSFDVTDYVNQELGGDRVVSFALVDSFMRARKVSFASREGGAEEHWPRLLLSGSPSSVVAVADAAVGEGAAANQPLGTQTQLHVYEAWASTASTDNGGMEVDIMESLAQWGPHITSHSLHWDGYGQDHKHTGSGHVVLNESADGFHTYGVNWQPGKVTFYVDGKETYSWSDPRVGSVEAYMLLSLQMGGWKDSYGDNKQVDDAKLPGEMVIDYVRVWSGS